MNKIICWVIFIIAIIEGLYIYHTFDLTKVIHLNPYKFNYDYDSFWEAEGSWLSNTELALPIQTVRIECWKELDHCWIITASVFDDLSRQLTLYSNIQKIKKWEDGIIETEQKIDSMGCTKSMYRLDKNTNTITSIRTTTKDDKNGYKCEIYLEEPIVLMLGDGYKRLDR